MHEFIFIENDMTTATPKQLGDLGERYIAERLRSEGYTIREIGNDKSKRGDLLIASPLTGELISIEVKTARLDTIGRYQACLTRVTPSRVCTKVTHSAILILVLVKARAGNPHVLALPVSSIASKKILSIPGDVDNYTGNYAQFVVKNRLTDAFVSLDLFSTSQTDCVELVHSQ